MGEDNGCGLYELSECRREEEVGGFGHLHGAGSRRGPHLSEAHVVGLRRPLGCPSPRSRGLHSYHGGWGSTDALMVCDMDVYDCVWLSLEYHSRCLNHHRTVRGKGELCIAQYSTCCSVCADFRTQTMNPKWFTFAQRTLLATEDKWGMERTHGADAQGNDIIAHGCRKPCLGWWGWGGSVPHSRLRATRPPPPSSNLFTRWNIGPGMGDHKCIPCTCRCEASLKFSSELREFCVCHCGRAPRLAYGSVS